MWVFAVIVMAIMVIVGIRRWGRVNDPMRNMATHSRRAWVAANASWDTDSFEDDDWLEEMWEDGDALFTELIYHDVIGNIFHDDD